MTILKFDGVLELVWKLHNQNVYIGGIDVFDAIRDAGFAGPVTVALGGATFTGDTLFVYEAQPDYSEYTPGSPAAFLVGQHNIFPLLEGQEGGVVTLWIADEPFNTLDPPPVR